VTERVERLAAAVAGLPRTVADLSDAVARQAAAIDTLERRVAMLMRREAARMAEEGGGVVIGDERPPHG
jgi:SlyX protein